LDGDRLDIHAIDTIFNQVEFPSIIQFIEGEGFFNIIFVVFKIGNDFIAYHGIGERFCSIDQSIHPLQLPFLPQSVLRIQSVEDVNQLVQYAHGEGAGTAGRIEDFTGIDRLDQRLGLSLIEQMFLFVVTQQKIQSDFSILRAHAALNNQLVSQICLERFIHHVVNDFAGSIETAGLLTGGGAGFRVVAGQQVFKNAA